MEKDLLQLNYLYELTKKEKNIEELIKKQVDYLQFIQKINSFNYFFNKHRTNLARKDDGSVDISIIHKDILDGVQDIYKLNKEKHTKIIRYSTKKINKKYFFVVQGLEEPIPLDGQEKVYAFLSLFNDNLTPVTRKNIISSLHSTNDGFTGLMTRIKKIFKEYKLTVKTVLYKDETAYKIIKK